MLPAAKGIVNGSFISFTLMFLSALFLGRLWCGWACPAGEPGAITSAG
jgi:ferredoxin-type protein NapH